MSQKNRYKSLLSSYVSHRGADISPFVDLIDQMFDEEKFFASNKDYACMSVNLSRLKPQAFTKKKMKKMDPRSAILASASCFPAFPMLKIGGENYIDGGYYDNVPITQARKMGAEYIIAVDLKSVGTNRVKEPQPDVVYIEPFVSLGSFLLFNHTLIMRNIQLGYQDCMKKLGNYIGYIYTFHKAERNKILVFEDHAKEFIYQFDIAKEDKLMEQVVEHLIKHQLNATITSNTEYQFPYLRILESCAYLFEMDDLQVYGFTSFCSTLKGCMDLYIPKYKEPLKEPMELVDLKKILTSFSKKELAYYFYRRISKNEESLRNELKALALLFPESFLIALILRYIEVTYSSSKK